MALYQKMFLKISIISVPKIVLLSSKAQFSSDLHLTARLYTPDGGTSWETVEFVDGMYTCSDLNDCLHQYMKKKGHKTTDAKKDDVYYIN